MFKVAVVTSTVEAFRAVFDDEYTAQRDINFRSVSYEYPQEKMQWPALFVQFRPSGSITWTGINPDSYAEIEEEHESGYTKWEKVRLGAFEGSIECSIFALSAQERDRLYDNLVTLVLMGREHATTHRFFETIEQNDLVRLNIQESVIENVGDSVGMGTPWDREALSYEASFRIPCIGQFYARTFSQELIPISEIKLHSKIKDDDNYQPPLESDDGWRSIS